MSSERHQQYPWVDSRTILRGVVGSTAHGLHTDDGVDDRDEMGVCIEPLASMIGTSEFEQFIYRTAAEREGRHDAPSKAGDLDLTIYSLRKWTRLALHGNPTVLLLLFLPSELCTVRLGLAGQLQELAPNFASREAGQRFLGYLTAQKQRLLGERGGMDVRRPQLIEKYGYDTKYAMHMVRLGIQGVEFLTTGRLTLPMPCSVKAAVNQTPRDFAQHGDGDRVRYSLQHSGVSGVVVYRRHYVLFLSRLSGDLFQRPRGEGHGVLVFPFSAASPSSTVSDFHHSK